MEPYSLQAKQFAALFHKPYANYLKTMKAYNHSGISYNMFKRNYDRWVRDNIQVTLRHWE